MKRRLAAILEADMVGFSRHVSIDETGTHTRLKALRADVIEPLIAEHGGRLVKVTGDGFLCVFRSVVDAAVCALNWQERVGIDQQMQPDTDRFSFRIGIGVGDIIMDGDDVFGEGVNVAARLEALADDGGILISEDAYRQLDGKVEAGFDDLGETVLKNIPGTVRVYRLRQPGPDIAGQKRSDPTILLPPTKPSIAVMPFANRSGDPSQDYFVDGITEDVITGLSRIRWFFVIARNSTFAYKGNGYDPRDVAGDLGVRYVLEGSVRKAGERVRVTAELIEGESGRQLWAQRYDADVEDIFALQDTMTETIIGAIEPEVGKHERERARATRPGSLDAWDLCQRGMAHLYRMTPEDLETARDLFDQAVHADPGLAPAHVGTAESHYYDVVYGFATDPGESRDRALEAADLAVAADPHDPSAHGTRGRALYLSGAHEEAISELDTALDLNPSYALAHYGKGAALVFSGHASEAVPHLETAIRLSPQDPNMGSFLVRLAEATFLEGDASQSVALARKALQQPNFQWSRYAILIAALGVMGRGDEAATYLRLVQTQRPEFSVRFVREGHLYGDAGYLDRYLDGLRAAGVPETAQV